MATKTRTFYRVVPPPGFSDFQADTLGEARTLRLKWGACPNGTPENKAYWKKQQRKCRIVKVIEITEVIPNKVKE